MFKYKKTMTFSLLLIIGCLSIIGGSYAFFTIRTLGNDTTSRHSVLSASKMLIYTDTTLIANNKVPLDWTATKEVTVENIGNKVVKYDLVWQTITNDLVRPEDFMMTITCESSIVGNTCPEITDQPVATTGVNKPIISNIFIDEDEIHTFSITFEYINQPTIDQSSDMNKDINGIMGIIDTPA